MGKPGSSSGKSTGGKGGGNGGGKSSNTGTAPPAAGARSGSSGAGETMKAPGAGNDSRIDRAAFESDPASYFRSLRE